jgi:K+-sensing histidine kinase KdpD
MIPITHGLYQLYGERGMRLTDKKRFVSLNIKLLVTILLALALGAVCYVLLTSLGDLAIEKYYTSPEAENTRTQNYIKDFSSYIQQNDIKMSDSRNINMWYENNKYVSLIIIKEKKIIFESNRPNNEMQSADADLYYTQQNDENFYPVKFADGNALVSVSDYSYVIWKNWVYIISIICAFLAVSLILLSVNGENIKRVILLSNEVKKIENEDIESKITISGNDEISALSKNIEHMRTSLIEKYADEKRAWDANYELITAISHDIRTPLTALIGYLELLSENKDNTNEQYKKYISVCKDKSMQLKNLTDKLFQYFVVFGGPNIQLSIEEYDAAMLIDQIVGEHVVYLTELGYNINMPEFDGDSKISVDVNFLMRVFDNVFSNVQKYAEKTQKVSINVKECELTLIICVSNIIKEQKEKVESTKIGLKTCSEIMKRLNGSFGYKSADGRFTCWIEIPVKK